MKKRILLLLALLFLMLAAVFLIPPALKRWGTETTEIESSTEPPTETLEEKTFPYETGSAQTEPTEETDETETEPDDGPGEPVDREKIPTNILIASDIHYMSKNLTDYGEAFSGLVDNGDGKVVKYVDEIWQAFAEEVMGVSPDALVLSGDLTINGEKINHQELAARLRELKAAGVPVYVIPGNHDINNGYATSYFGNEQSYIENVTPEEFREIYREFGYDEAASYAPDSMSYLSVINDTTWLMMLDSCIYDPYNEVYGEIREETLEWMEEILKDAYSQGITVIPVGHHNLQELSRVYVEECVLENNREVIKLLERYLTPVYISGHLHLQRTMKHILEPGIGSDVYGIWEIVSNSLIIPPCQYGNLMLNADGSLSYHTRNVDVSAWAAKHGETNTDLLDFAAFSDGYLRAVVKQQTYRVVENIPDELREVMADYYADLCRDYYAGKKINYAEWKKEFGYGLWDRFMNPSVEFRRVDGMLRDGMAENNQAEIPNPLRLKR